MSRDVSIFLAIGIALISIALWPHNNSVTIKSSATLLFYNSPAAIKRGSEIYVGYITNDGVVEVSSFSSAGAHISTVPITAHERADDHGAPALWSSGDEILIATSQHSSDLHLFSLQNGRVTEKCTWPGRFTYPRFDDTGGTLKLYLRSDDGNSGDLVSIDVAGCGNPQVEFRAGANRYLYAVPPHGKNAWSLYDKATGYLGGAYVDGHEFVLDASPLDSARAWSVSGDYFAVTRHTDDIECCGKGQMIAELYRNDQRIYTSPVLPAPFYPEGIVLNQTGSEGLFPSRMGLVRRSLPDIKQTLPSCENHSEFNISGQYVKGGSGEYVWVAFDKEYGGKKFDHASVRLCIPI